MKQYKDKLIEFPQTLHDEETGQLSFTFYREAPVLMACYKVLSILTLGILSLAASWFVTLYAAFNLRLCKSHEATHVLVRSAFTLELVRTCWLETSTYGSQLMFEHQHVKYTFNGADFQALKMNFSLSYSQIIKSFAKGYSADIAKDLRKVYGPCQIRVPVKSIWVVTLEQLSNPFFIFQALSCVLWYCDEYTLYASAILLMTSISLCFNINEIRSNSLKLQELGLYSCEVEVLRGNSKIKIISDELVPGDLFVLPIGNRMPCDALLISGTATVDESSLTGESVPVVKEPLPNEMDLFYEEADWHHSLFEGTSVLIARNIHDNNSWAVVTKTGFSTQKGRLMRSILYPKPNKFKFYEDSLKFVTVLAILAILGFSASIPLQVSQGIPTLHIIFRSLDLITVAVPPALPAAMTVGTAFAVARLLGKGILCLVPARVNVAGKVATIVFDKTGTLTEEGVTLVGVQPVKNAKFLPLCNSPSVLAEANPALLENLASCHSIATINSEMRGDPMDIRLFDFTGWILEDTGTQVYDAAIKTIVRPPTTKPFDAMFDEEGNLEELLDLPYELGVLHTFHFNSKAKRLGVIVKNLADGSAKYYVKGAPEVIMLRADKSSIPSNVEQVINFYAQAGYRIIACACAKLEGFKFNDIHAKSQSEIEQGLEFLGLVILQNRLKGSARQALSELRNANITSVMATGDALTTAVSVARDCGMLDLGLDIYSGSMDGEVLTWELCEHSSHRRDFCEDSLAFTKLDSISPWSSEASGTFAIALSGRAFQYIVDLAEQNHAQKWLLDDILRHGIVFARLNPEQKTLLVTQLQERGLLVAMCGDGANDCGALKAADVGISLSKAEASMAAHFTSLDGEVSSVPTVLKEGRCALATSTQSFKFMALYSMVQFSSVSLLYVAGSNLSDNQFIWIDLLTILPLAVAMSYSCAHTKLSQKQLTASLMSLEVLGSVIMQTVLAALFQFLVFSEIRAQDYYEAIDPAEVDEASYSWENSALFLVSNFQYLVLCLIFSRGKPFREPLSSNIPLSLALGLMIFFGLYMIVSPSDWLLEVMGLHAFPDSFRLYTFTACLAYAVAASMWDFWALPRISRLK
mmetsp:Transcript_9620/g.18746  ORF Transcript_9620/g.18746 Transcript_9620/m.18746 type:complete len:1093 (+) Transcript_9620:13-3291(+)